MVIIILKSAIKNGAKTIISNYSFEGMKDGVLYINLQILENY